MLEEGMERAPSTTVRITRGPAHGGSEMLWTILMIILVLWVIGLIADIGGGLIHLLLVVAAVVFLFQLLSGRRTVV
jgi:hypothetical protein